MELEVNALRATGMIYLVATAKLYRVHIFFETTTALLWCFSFLIIKHVLDSAAYLLRLYGGDCYDSLRV